MIALISQLPFFWGYVAPLMPTYITSSANIVGFQNGVLYDILDDNNGVGDVAVGAASFNITCGFLPNVNVTGDPSNQTWTIKLEVSTMSPFYGIQFQITPTGKQVILLVKYYVNRFLAAPNILKYVDPASLGNNSVSTLVSSQKLNVPLKYSVFM
jgi:hypothetical protein